MNAVVAHKNQSQRGLFLTCLIWPARPMTKSGIQRRQMKKPTTETPVFCGAVIMAMERPAKPRAQLRDTQLIGLRSWIASPSKKGEEELLTIAADVHERDREEVEAVDHVDVEEQALVVTLRVVLPRVHSRVEEVDAIEGNGEGGDEHNRGDQEAGPDEVAVD